MPARRPDINVSFRIRRVTSKLLSGSIDLINQGISALINSPIEPAALPAVIDKGHPANIPVVIGDVGVAGKYDAFIVSNNEDGGKLAAQYMIEHLKDKPGNKRGLGH